jgi:hypothetical protein
MRRFWVAAVASAVVASAAPAWGWHGAGHMAIAIIAYRDLGPERAGKVADILRQHQDYKLWMSEKPADLDEDKYLFMRASVWPDDIKSPTHPSHSFNQPTWHYFDLLYRIPKDLPEPTPEPGEHIIEAEAKNEEVLRTSTDPAARARAVCWLFHLIGDIHQPLHATALVSKQFPQGDRGGNLEWISGTEGAMNLHTFWDGLWNRETVRDSARAKAFSALRADDLDILKVEAVADRSINTNRRKGIRELKQTAFDKWVEESFKLAKKEVYLNGGLAAGTARSDAAPLPAGYEDRARKLGEKRLAVAGYRLADRMRRFLNL